MSQISGPGILGTARIDVVANTAPLYTSLDQAKVITSAKVAAIQQSISGSGMGGVGAAAPQFREADVAAQGFFGTLKEGNRAFTSTVGQVFKFVGHVSLISTVAVGAAAGLRSLWQWLVNVGTESEKAGRAIESPLLGAIQKLQSNPMKPVIDFGSLRRDAEEIPKKLKRISEIAIELQHTPFREWTPSVQKLREELAQLEADVARVNTVTARERDAQKERDAHAASLKKEREDSIAAQKSQNEGERMLADWRADQRRKRKEEVEQEDRDIEAYLRAFTEMEEDRLRVIREQNQALRQQASILNGIRSQASQQFGAESIATRQLTEIRDLLDTIASQRRSVYPTDGGPFR